MFEWAESYDTKDWDRFLRNATPTLHVEPPMSEKGLDSLVSADGHRSITAP
jgi:Scytalone dehydratase